MDYEKDMELEKMSTALENNYELPNGEVITICSKIFRCPKFLFQLAHIGIEAQGIHETTYISIMKCDENIQKELCGNIVLSGGSNMFLGISHRMNKEILVLPSDGINIKAVSPLERKYSV